MVFCSWNLSQLFAILSHFWRLFLTGFIYQRSLNFILVSYIKFISLFRLVLCLLIGYFLLHILPFCHSFQSVLSSQSSWAFRRCVFRFCNVLKHFSKLSSFCTHLPLFCLACVSFSAFVLIASFSVAIFSPPFWLSLVYHFWHLWPLVLGYVYHIFSLQFVCFGVRYNIESIW